MDQTHVTFRWKDRNANGWRTERLPGVEFLKAASSRTRTYREGFTRSDTTGCGTLEAEDCPTVPGVLLMLATPADPLPGR